MANRRSRGTIFPQKAEELEEAKRRALEQTIEALHTKVVRSEIMPRDGGAMQNEKTFVDVSDSVNGRVHLITEGPYARRLYYHPEYHYQTYENAFAQGKWLSPWLPGGRQDKFAAETFAKLMRRELKKGGESG